MSIKRQVQAFRLRYPLVEFIFCLILGQYFQIVFELFWLYSAGLSALCWYLLGRKNLLAPMFVVIGSISSLSLLQVTAKLEPNDSGSYFVRVADAPRYRKVGEVSHVFELLEFAGQQEHEVRLRSSGHRIFCRGKDLPWENASLLEQGDYAFIRGRFKRVVKNLNPFSYAQREFRHGILHECRLEYVSNPIRHESLVSAYKKSMISKVKEILGQGESSGLFLSMTLGEQDTVSTQTERAFKNTGLAHLLVVSGYQVSIIYISLMGAGIYLLKSSRQVYFHLPIRKIAAVASFVACTIYASLVGFDSSVLRALFATFIFIVCSLFERRKNFVNSILVSLLMLQIIFPLSIFEPGVELTFAALIGMALAGDSQGLIGFLKSSLFASLATSCVSFFWFGSFSLLGLILNPIFASLISIISCNLGFIALVLLMTGLDSSGLMLSLVAFCLDNFKDLVVWCSLNFAMESFEH